MSDHLIIYTDGGARGNPGPAAIGVVVKDVSGNLVKEWGSKIGEGTNNQAEYTALLEALKYVSGLKPKKIECRLDSELVVKQMCQEYKVKDADLQKLFIKVWNYKQLIPDVTFTHVPRGQNKRADQLVNQALDNLI